MDPEKWLIEYLEQNESATCLDIINHIPGGSVGFSGGKENLNSFLYRMISTNVISKEGENYTLSTGDKYFSDDPNQITLL